MKRMISFLFIAFFAVSTQAHEGEAHLSLSLDQAYYSDYVWRGITFNEDGVNQGSLDIAVDAQDLGTFGFNIWYNMDLDDENGYNNSVTEVDYTLYWEKSYGDFTLGAGYIYYEFPQDKTIDTREIYVSVGYDTLLAPSLTIYRDIDETDGYYIEVAIGHDFEIVEDYVLNVGATLGWADGDASEFHYGVDESGFTNYSIGASMDFAVYDNVTITPSVMWFGLLDEAEKAATDNEDGLVAGVNLNVSF